MKTEFPAGLLTGDSEVAMCTKGFRCALPVKIILAASFTLIFLFSYIGSSALAAGRALLVGIEDYPNPRLKLRGVRDDVELVRKALVQRGIFSHGELKILLDRQATKANIVKGFKEWLTNGTSPGDTVLIYYSGHGMQVWDEIGDSEDGLAQALICWDAKILAPKERRVFHGVAGHAWNVGKTQNLLLDNEINTLLKKMTGRTVIFVCDSCFSGTMYKDLDPFFVQNKTIDQPEGYESVFDKRTTEDVVLKAKRRTSGITGNVVIPGVSLAALTSSEDSEPSQIRRFDRDPKGFHSVFTWFLYHGLTGEANGNGAITLGSLADYVRKGVKQAGFAQTPQHVFSPETLASLPLVSPSSTARLAAPTPAPKPPAMERPSRIGCSIGATGVSSHEVQQLKSRLGQAIPSIFWTEETNEGSCRIALEKKGDVYGARLSDSTGSSWETNQGPSLAAIVEGVTGNLRAFVIQKNLEALRNRISRLRFDVQVKVKSPRTRSDGEVAGGDFVRFESKTKTPGYLYLFNVNSAGVINPLYPPLNALPEKLKPDQAVLLGAGDAFQVKGPFGKEMVFAILCEKPPPGLNSWWNQNRIGTPDSDSFLPQQQFLDALWNELTISGKPKGEWASAMWVIKSFKD
jgi:hypothetical protein